MSDAKHFLDQVKLHMDHALGRPAPDEFREECGRFDRNLRYERRPRPCLGASTHGHRLRMEAK